MNVGDEVVFWPRVLRRYRAVANRACGKDAWLFLAALALWCEGVRKGR